jgi:hypothetical protein
MGLLKIEGEEWLPIKGHEEKYQVSNKGRVKSLPCIIGAGLGKRKRGTVILKPQGQAGDKRFFCLYRQSLKYCVNLDKLMAEHWGEVAA